MLSGKPTPSVNRSKPNLVNQAKPSAWPSGFSLRFYWRAEPARPWFFNHEVKKDTKATTKLQSTKGYITLPSSVQSVSDSSDKRNYRPCFRYMSNLSTLTLPSPCIGRGYLVSFSLRHSLFCTLHSQLSAWPSDFSFRVYWRAEHARPWFSPQHNQADSLACHTRLGTKKEAGH